VVRGVFAAALLAVSPAVLAGDMRPVTVNGARLEYATSGKGDPVLLIHGSVLADAFAPLARDPALGKYRLIRYHRRGFAGSGRAQGPVSVAQQAADARALLERLGVKRAHVVGHSYGAVIALQLALDAPGVVRSLALLEPPMFAAVPSGPAYREGLGPIVQTHQDGNNAAAIDAFLTRIAGDDKPAIERALGRGAIDTAVADADTFFEVELPALRQWAFSRDQAGRIHHPVLTVVGAKSVPAFQEVNVLLKEWFPRAEELVVPDVGHVLPIVNPAPLAQGLARFYIGQRGTK
jgi:pimeloyl-ACP methyl ester carboxylesterase